MGKSTEELEKTIKEALNATYPEMYELYDDVSNWEYVRNKAIYEEVNAEYVPPERNEWLQQLNEAIKQQTKDEIKNLSQSMGFAVMVNGKRVFTPFAEYYQNYVDAACMDILTGTFDYNTVIRRVVTQMTNSGLRSVTYASGWSNRTPVAVRRAVMTGIGQMTEKINEMNAVKLGTEHFEIDWHANARPTHREWQGKVWTKEQLVSVCGLGTGAGLCGWNCYHTYYPFIPGISERLYSDNWLKTQNAKEDQTKSWNGREYNAYESTQKQRQMETAMRAQRQKVDLLKEADADKDDILLAKCKYQGQLNEYSRYCKHMGLTPQRERIYYDMRGRIAPGNISYEKGITNKRDSKQDEYKINRDYIESNEFKRKFNGITGNAKTDEAIYKYAKAGLIHRDGTNKEDLYILSAKSGKVLGKNVTSNEDSGVKPNKSILKAVRENQGDLIGLHTHPTKTPPTGSDFSVSGYRKYNLGIVACSDGSVFVYRHGDKIISKRYIDAIIEDYKIKLDKNGKRMYPNEKEAHLAALKQISKDYGIAYGER